MVLMRDVVADVARNANDSFTHVFPRCAEVSARHKALTS
jgi:hypothetical protein